MIIVFYLLLKIKLVFCFLHEHTVTLLPSWQKRLKPVSKYLNPRPLHNHKVQFNNLVFSPENRKKCGSGQVEALWERDAIKVEDRAIASRDKDKHQAKVSRYSAMMTTEKETECRTSAAQGCVAWICMHLFVSADFVCTAHCFAMSSQFEMFN